MRIFLILACACLALLPACSATSPKGTSASASIEGTPGQALASADKIEIPVGTPASRVLTVLGPADVTDYAEGRREIWRYTRKRAEYVYTSKSGGVATLVIGKYVAAPQPESPGQPLLLTIVFDAAKTVADFNFALMAH